jgi:microcin C transport system substrate-binding protein
MPRLISASLCVLSLLFIGSMVGAQTTVSHGSSIHGELKYPSGFTHFEYVNPDAPKGGDIKLSATGSFDSLHPFILKGDTAVGVSLLFETLLTSSYDEVSSSYGLIAESVEVPVDKSWVAFKIRPEARWHDGSPITVDDVIYSFNTLKSVGHPTYRTYY